MANFLVTGGAGFIGSHLTEFLAKLLPDSKIFVIDKTINYRFTFPNVYIVPLDISRIFEANFGCDFDAVFHLAAQINLQKSFQDPVNDAEINFLGTIKLLEYFKNKKTHVVFSSSGGAIYSGPMPQKGYTEDGRIVPFSPYGISKYSAELYLDVMREKHGLKYTALRYSNVYGPRQGLGGESGIVGLIKQNLDRDLPTKINNFGKSTRDYVHVKDVVLANFLAAREPINQAVNISTGMETSVRRVQEIFRDCCPCVKFDYNDHEVYEVERSCLNNSRAKQLLKWQPKISLEQGIAELVNAD